MGYDMTMVEGTTEAEQLALDAAQKVIDEAVAERNKYERGTPEFNAAQEEVMRRYDEKFELPSNYFRLNVYGMSYCCDFMAEREMIYPSSYSEGPQFPDLPYPKREEFGTDAEYMAACDKWDEEYQELSLPVVSWHPAGGDTIPSHKFSDNSGWLVTAEECAAAVAAAKASELPAPTVIEDGLEVPVPWWPSWVDFLERASQRGGFRVY